MDETETGAWGTPQVVADALSSVSCPAAGECAAVGSQGYGGRAVAVAEAAGTWGTPQVLPGSLNVDAALTSVSCPSAGDCTAGGYYDAQPYGRCRAWATSYLADERNGTWRPVHTVTGSFTTNGDIDVDSVDLRLLFVSRQLQRRGVLRQVRRPDTRVRGLRGRQHVADHARRGRLLGGRGPSWLDPLPRQRRLLAAGFYLDGEDDSHALVVNEVSGTWQAAQQAAASLNVGGSAEFRSMACVSVGSCGTAGGYYANSAGGFVGLVVTEANGKWGPGEAVATSSIRDGLAQVNMISCPTAGNCAVGGVIDNGDDYMVAFVVDETPASVPGPPRHVTAVAGTNEAKVSWSLPSGPAARPSPATPSRPSPAAEPARPLRRPAVSTGSSAAPAARPEGGREQRGRPLSARSVEPDGPGRPLDAPKKSSASPPAKVGDP